MQDILLATLNARYIHSSLGLRYLLANMGELQARTRLIEYTINQRALDIVEDLIAQQPKIIGFGVYIWNVEQTEAVIRLLKAVRPEIIIIIGGPEVSHEYDEQSIVRHADHLIVGQGDLTFATDCQQVLAAKPVARIIHAPPFELHDIQLPYSCYTAEDIAHRIIYVEASRGCPFKCEFCLSALDKTAVPFDTDLFLQQMQALYERGARHFKFVDRTFNLKVDSSLRIMEFFLQKNDPDLFLHFELVPDHLPEKLKTIIARFPPHKLQFEVGIQSLNPDVQQLISRKQNNDKARANLLWLAQHTHAHIHADLIIGLPGEDLQSFARGFNELVAMNPHEIQVGLLKRLRGTPVIRHTQTCGMRFNPQPPYTILCNHLIDFVTMQRLARFARYWDMIINSGRFTRSKPLLLGDNAFENMMQLCDWLHAETGQTHEFALERLFNLLHQYLTEQKLQSASLVENALLEDYRRAGLKGQAGFSKQENRVDKSRKIRNADRQQRHLI
ncbi:MAG: hypothetical protein QG652_1786 [Pseudomonadota bacterium]|nr:hypothetical protein [Pseudomonadota bacterium]